MPAGSTYTPIATTTLGSATGTVTFSSLGSYTDLIIEVAGLTNIPENPYMRFNSDSGTNYSFLGMRGRSDSGSPGATNASNQNAILINLYTAFLASTQSKVSISIPNYYNSTTFKTTICSAITAPGDGTFSGNELSVGMWRSTAPITSISLITPGTNWSVGTTFTLFGVTAA